MTIAAYPASVTVRRRLDAELVRRRLVASRAQGVEAIRAGRVLVAGSRAEAPARLVDPAESVALIGDAPRYVSRGGDKLAAALAAFAVAPRHRRALDAGASTGGFTDCLLQGGAAEVCAVDVGHGQLAWSLRTDPRVTVLERTNVRMLDPDVHRAVLREVRDALAAHGIVVVAAIASPLRGSDGNVEFLFHARRVGGADPLGEPVDDATLDAVASVSPSADAGTAA